jgi:hypothetical protein
MQSSPLACSDRDEQTKAPAPDSERDLFPSFMRQGSWMLVRSFAKVWSI